MLNMNLIKSAIISAIVALFTIPLSVSADTSLDSIAEIYVKMVLRVGHYDKYMVDFYFGPEEWKPVEPSNEDAEPPYDDFLVEAEMLENQLRSIDSSQLNDLPLMRYRFLHGQISALIGRIRMLTGTVMPFDEETRILFDVVLPPFDTTYYDSLLAKLDELLPGEGSVADRFNNYQAQLKISPDKAELVFKTGMNAARDRISRYIDLPAADSVSIEVVHGAWWTADCRYQGRGHSHMKLNVDNPFYLDEAITFPCHELYPGHHVSYLYTDKYLFEHFGWVEFSVSPIFCPLSGLYEGIAEYGIDLAFPKEEWVKFVKDSLCPIAGIDTSLVDLYYDMWKLKYSLYPVESHVARLYLNGEIDSMQAKAMLKYYAIYGEDEVEDRIAAYDNYRSYVVTYYVGKDLIRDHIKAVTGGADDPESKWAAFAELLKTPLTPANLQSERK